MSVALEDASLAETLREINARAGISLVLHGSSQEKTSARFQSLPLDEALHRLIEDNFVLLYSAETERPEVEIWIVGSGSRVPAVTAVPEPPMPRARPDTDVFLDSRQRQEAVWMLGDLKDGSGMSALTGVLKGDEDPDVRRQAAWVLEQLGDPRAVDALAAAVSRDGDESVRQRAVEALAKLGGRAAIAPLRSVLEGDPDPFVRYEALTSLAEIAGDEAGDVLLRASEDPDELVRDKARELLEDARRR